MQEIRETKILSVVKDVVDIFGDDRISHLTVSRVGDKDSFAIDLDCQCVVAAQRGFDGKWTATCDNPHTRRHYDTRGLSDYGKMVEIIKTWDCQQPY